MNESELLAGVENNELFKFLGIKVTEATAERVVITMEVTPKVHQYVGIMNGGVSMYLAETAASIGAVLAADLSKVTPVGIEINGNHLRAVSKGILTVTATPIYPGRSVSVWKIESIDERGKMICTSRITIMIQKRPAAS